MTDRTVAAARPAGLVGLGFEIVALLDRVPMSFLQLLARLAMAEVFWASGQTKIASWQATVSLFASEYKVPLLPPELAATLAASVELSMPVLLVLGLCTRLATLPMIGMTLVIQIFVYPDYWSEHLLWASALLLILTRGPGAFSLDHVIWPRLFRRS